jgi:5'(3')-deoxyribonucleotidase
MLSFKEYMKEIEADKGKPQVFLDLDGVLADFFSELWDMYQAQKNEDAWENIKHELTPARQNKLVNSIENASDFFANLGMLEGGKKVLEYLNKNNIPFTILSSPLRGERKEDSIEGKRIWLKKHGLGSVPQIFTHDKAAYAKTNGVPNILIDDFGKNISAWKKAGGIGIKHDDASYLATIAQLHDILEK